MGTPARGTQEVHGRDPKQNRCDKEVRNAGLKRVAIVWGATGQVLCPVSAGVPKNITNICGDCLGQARDLVVEEKRRREIANVKSQARHHDTEAAVGEKTMLDTLVANHVERATRDVQQGIRGVKP